MLPAGASCTGYACEHRPRPTTGAPATWPSSPPAPGPACAPGEGKVVRLPQTTLARLALGAYAPADPLARLERPPAGQTRALLEALFPLRHPHLSLPDRFYRGNSAPGDRVTRCPAAP